MATQARTNLGPLTTAFSYPASCTFNVLQCSTCNQAWQGQTCINSAYNSQGVEDNPECWPPRSNTAISTGPVLAGWGFYSPGISCPVGYATACTAVGGSVAGFGFQFSPSPQETAAGCCPLNYTCQYAEGEFAQTCVSVASTGSFPVVQCSSGTSNGLGFHQVPATVPATVTKESGTASATVSELVTVTNIELFAPLFQLMYQSTDLPTTTTTSSRHTTGSSSPAGGATTTNANTNSPVSSGLSSGAIAGIALGSAVVGLGLLGALIYLLLTQRQQKRQRQQAIAQYSAAGPGGPLPPMYVPDSSAKSTPVAYVPVYEAHTDTPRQELP